ncbi:MAG: hypothetical protein AB8B61_08575 [Cyclobacteriaceae bacterium]
MKAILLLIFVYVISLNNITLGQDNFISSKTGVSIGYIMSDMILTDEEYKQPDWENDELNHGFFIGGNTIISFKEKVQK